MGNLEKPKPFTEEEITLLKEKFSGEIKNIDLLIRIQKDFTSVYKNDKEKLKSMHDMMYDLRLLATTMAEEPELLLLTKSEMAITMGITSVNDKKLVGFKKKISISILNKLDKEMALVKKAKADKEC